MSKCKICGKKAIAKKLCSKHYKQMYRHGEILDRTIYDSNEIIEYDDYAELILYDKDCNEKVRTLIDLDDVDRVKNYKWTYCKGYVICRKHNLRLHRFITNCPDDKIPDHINHNTLDNRKSNLKIGTQQDNMHNLNINRTNTSGHAGVSYRKDRQKWRAYITLNNKQIGLGNFDTKEEAIRARKEAEKKYFIKGE